ncbi:hypothetical protein [Metapseudomonas otitidis]|uniref:hypothetical protein n=1 Tax=Metapseudomonas otitidis TaxID=319939 RepID=UPI00244861E8|nr:hypothetical protein [Pseudomonas otitidis]MDG9785309.1 hypothetical protein [Pseudomonas otitidis]
MNEQNWTGEGLPPVGVIVKLRTKRSPEDAFEGWGKAEIMYSSKGAVVWRWQGHSREFGAEWDEVEFEAIRTPEQIAEEERKAAIEEMAVLMKEARFSAPSTEISPYEMAKVYAERLYQAGYRKAGDA